MRKIVINRTNALAVLFFIMIIILSGCGSSGGGGGGGSDASTEPATEPNTDPETETETDAETAIEPGTYHIYAHRNAPCSEPAIGYFDYDITITQEAGSDQAFIWKDNQYLSCTADNADKTLNCTGEFIFEDESTNEYTNFEYSFFSLTQQSEGDLTGETEYQVIHSGWGSYCNSTSELTTRLPEYGSFVIRNLTSDYTLRYVEFLSCGAASTGLNELDSATIPPYGGHYFRDKTPACYDILISVDSEPTSDSVGVLIERIILERANTIVQNITDGESNLLRIEKNHDHSPTIINE